MEDSKLRQLVLLQPDMGGSASDEKEILRSVKRASCGPRGDAIILGHATGYVHRDLKPAGLTTTPRGNRRYAQTSPV